METNPYTIPSSPSQPRDLHGPYGAFRKNGTLSAIIATLLIIDALVLIFLLLLRQAITPLSPLLESEKFWNVIHITQLGINLVIVILFCIWINRSCKNAWLLNAPKMRTTPGIAVGYFFIPVLALWKPFTTMGEIRNASYGQKDTLKHTLSLWWAFWLALILIATIATILSDGQPDAATRTIIYKLDTVKTPLKIVLDYLLVAIVLSITRAQKNRAAEWRA